MNALSSHAPIHCGTAVAAGESIYVRIGRLLDLPIGTESDAVRVARDGVPVNIFSTFVTKSGLRAHAVAPASTLRRRLAKAERLTPSESERLLRLARVYAEAVELFGDETAARAWLNKSEEFVVGEPAITPFELAETDTGARLVESLIGRTAHGF